MLEFYGYAKCGTCRKALKWLEEQGFGYEFIDITETPPTKKLLNDLLKTHDLKRLFNTSGQQYRAMNIKDRLSGMTEAEAIDLLAAEGRLCKRPIVTDGRRHTVGFKDDEFAEVWR
ncbi:Spx/MgsR family RNA polymerase-binding regulatory protein [bacterium]|nr:Spx/MgsR family RNA polymerase-binding regulatory protein [bacterium]